MLCSFPKEMGIAIKNTKCKQIHLTQYLSSPSTLSIKFKKRGMRHSRLKVLITMLAFSVSNLHKYESDMKTNKSNHTYITVILLTAFVSTF